MADATELRSRVARARVGHLATLRPDGAPHLVPFCFAVEGDLIYSAVDNKPKRPGTTLLARVQNVTADSRVCVLVDRWSEDWTQLWWIRVDGRARTLPAGSPEEAAALALLRAKYPQYAASPPPGPVLAIRADRWSDWSGEP